MQGSLSQTQVCTEMAQLLGRFLPGSGSPQWQGHVSFATVAQAVGVGDYWTATTKVTAIARLLDLTLQHRRSVFEPLILTVVQEGLRYCSKSGNPITRDEILQLNHLLRGAGFQFPTLVDPAFLQRLPRRTSAPPGARTPPTESIVQASIQHQRELELLRNRFYGLSRSTERQRAGFELERLLNDLFGFFELAPRAPFRLVGEQIDGSFTLDNQTYLVEAKWHGQRTPMEQLLVFQGKVEAKSTYTRGVFFTMSGLSTDASEGFARGRPSRLFVVNGHDLMTVLEGQIALDALLRAKQRRLDEEGRIMVSVSELLGNGQR